MTMSENLAALTFATSWRRPSASSFPPHAPACRWCTHAAAMVPQIDGIGRPCMECCRGVVWDELTDIPRTLRPM